MSEVPLYGGSLKKLTDLEQMGGGVSYERGTPVEQMGLNGHLTRVIYHQVY